eukprot:m.64842 g.64842  ORF g.64842 m.64842 type:complete len:1047 (+) comp11679_c0_seq2:256-3396(+)
MAEKRKALPVPKKKLPAPGGKKDAEFQKTMKAWTEASDATASIQAERITEMEAEMESLQSHIELLKDEISQRDVELDASKQIAKDLQADSDRRMKEKDEEIDDYLLRLERAHETNIRQATEVSETEARNEQLSFELEDLRNRFKTLSQEGMANQDMRDKFSEALASVKLLEKQNAALTEERDRVSDQLRAQLSLLGERSAEFEVERQQLKSEISALKRQRDRANEKLNDLENDEGKEIESLEDELDEVCAENEKLQSDLRKLNEAMAAAEEEGKRAKMEIAAMEDDCNDMKSDMESLQKELETVKQEKEGQTTALTEKLDALEKELAEANSELQTTKETYANEKSSTTKELEVAQEEGSKLKKELEESKKVSESLQTEIATLKTAQEKGEELLTASQKQIEKLEEDRSLFEKKVTEYTLQHAEVNQKLSTVQTDKVALQSQLEGQISGLQRDISMLTEERDALKAKTAELGGAKQASDAALETIKKETDSLRTEKQSLQEQLASLTKTHEAATNNAADLASKLETLKSEKGKLEEQIAEKERDSATRANELARKAQELEQNASSAASLEDKLMTQINARQSLEAEVQGLTANLAASKEKQTELSHSVNSMEQECARLKKDVERLEEKLATTTVKLENVTEVRMEAEKNLARVQAMHDMLVAEKSSLQESIANANKTQAAFMTEKAQYDQKIISLENKVNAAEQKCNNITAEKDSVISTLRGEIQSINTSLTERKHKIRHLTDTLEAVERSKSKLALDLQSKTEATDSSEETLKARVSLLDAQNTSMELALKQEQESCENLKQKLEEVQKEMDTNQKTISELQGELSSLQEKHNSVNDQLKAAEGLATEEKAKNEEAAKAIEEYKSAEAAHQHERNMLGTQLTNLAFLQLELNEDEALRLKVRTETVLKLFMWASRARAKRDESLAPEQRLKAVYARPEGPAPSDVPPLSQQGTAGPAASTSGGDVVTVTFTNTLSGHGLTVDVVAGVNVITKVKPGSAAGKTGAITPGMRIIEINDTPTTEPNKKACLALLKKQKNVTIVLQSPSR